MYHYTNLPFYPVQTLFFRGQPIPGDYNPSKYPACLSDLLLYFLLNDSFTFSSYILHPTFLPPSALDSPIKGDITKSLRLSAMLDRQFQALQPTKSATTYSNHSAFFPILSHTSICLLLSCLFIPFLLGPLFLPESLAFLSPLLSNNAIVLTFSPSHFIPLCKLNSS